MSKVEKQLKNLIYCFELADAKFSSDPFLVLMVILKRFTRLHGQYDNGRTAGFFIASLGHKVRFYFPDKRPRLLARSYITSVYVYPVHTFNMNCIVPSYPFQLTSSREIISTRAGTSYTGWRLILFSVSIILVPANLGLRILISPLR